MRRVVVTGLGIISSLGNNSQEVLESLRNLKSGIRFNPEYEEIGFRSHVCGLIDVDWKKLIDRKKTRFMGQAAGYAYLATEEALKMSGLFDSDDLHNPRVGIVAGSGGGSNQEAYFKTPGGGPTSLTKIKPSDQPTLFMTENQKTIMSRGDLRLLFDGDNNPSL